MEPQTQNIHVKEAADAKFEEAVQKLVNQDLNNLKYSRRVQREAQRRMNAIITKEEEAPEFRPPSDEVFEAEVQEKVQRDLEKLRYSLRKDHEYTSRLRILLDATATDAEKDYRLELRKESHERRNADEVEHRLRFLKKQKLDETLEEKLATEEKIHRIVVEILQGRQV